MGAPKGNQFWKLRSKHGMDALFSDPEKLWEAATEYFEWCDANPLIEIDFKGKYATQVHMPKMRAYTITGLCLYLDCNTVYFNHFKTTETYNNNKDFGKVLTRIEETIYNQKFTGAAAGFLNPSIIARDLGLRDNVDMTSKGESMNAPSINVYPKE